MFIHLLPNNCIIFHGFYLQKDKIYVDILIHIYGICFESEM